MVALLRFSSMTETRVRASTSTEPVPRTEGVRWRLLLLLGVVSYLYFNLFALPHTPYLLGGDQAFFWMDAQRMLGGEHVYQDFFQFTPPGTDLVYLVLFKLFGLRVWATNATVLVLGVALCWVCFSVASEIMAQGLAALATLLFLTLIYGRLLNGTHHLFSLLIVMCAVKIGMRHRTPRWLLGVGALLGAASFFTQTRGAMAALAFATFLAWERWQKKEAYQGLLRQYLALGFAFAGALLALDAHFIVAVGLKQVWYFQITYVRTYMVHGVRTWYLGLPLAWNTLPQLFAYLFVYILLPVVYVFVLVRCWREREHSNRELTKVVLLSLVGTFLLSEVGLSLNWLRLYAVSMPGIILLLWVISQWEKVQRYAVALIWIAVAGLAIHQTRARHSRDLVTTTLPGGRIVVPPQRNEELQWIALRTKPGQFLFEAGGPTLYLPLQLFNPVFLDEVHTNNEATPEYVELAIQELEAKKVPLVLWVSRLNDAEDPRAGEAIALFRNFLQERYDRSRVFSNGDEIWARK